MENNQNQIMKPGRIVGFLTLLLLLVCLVLKVLATSWDGTQSGIHAQIYHAKLLSLVLLLAFVGYYRIGAIGKSVGVMMFFIIMIPLFLLNFINSANAGLGLMAFLGLLFIVPIILVFFAIKEKQVEFWKRLVPLSIPGFFIISMFFGSSVVVAIFTYIGIGLVAVVALIGKK